MPTPDGTEGGSPRPSLTQRTLHSYLWVAVQAAGSKVVTVAGYVTLTYLLSEEAWGLYGLTLTVTALMWRIQLVGVREVLVHRHRRRHLWERPAMSLSLALGLLSGGLTAAAAPVASGIAAAMVAFAPIQLRIAVGSGGRGWRDVARVFTVPIVASVAALVPAAALAETVPDGPLRQWLRVGVVAGVFAAIGLPLLRWGMADTWTEMTGQVRSVVGRVRVGRVSVDATPDGRRREPPRS